MSESVLAQRITACNKCPRLVAFRVQVARKYAHLYPGEKFWAKPVPGYGDPHARLVIVGLAPAARGGNRTGRVFTGDESGNNLARALYQLGLASNPSSTHARDGLSLRGVYLTAAVKCVPPENRPNKSEIVNCMDHLVEEIKALEKARVFVALGSIAWYSLTRAVSRALGAELSKPPGFSHGAEVRLPTRLRGEVILMASYHPSPRNMRTGVFTHDELVEILGRAASLAGLL